MLHKFYGRLPTPSNISKIEFIQQQSLLNKIRQGKIKGIENLFKLDINRNIVDAQGETPLTLSIQQLKNNPKKWMRIIEELLRPSDLLKIPAELNTTTIHRKLPLHVAIKNNYLYLVKDLMELGADIHLKDAKDRNALMLATEKRLLPMMNLLIEKGGKLFSNSYLFKAIKDNDNEYLAALLKANINVHEPNVEGYTPLEWAALYGIPDIIFELIKAGANVNESNKLRTPLLVAAKAQNLANMKALLKKGADAKAAGNDGYVMEVLIKFAKKYHEETCHEGVQLLAQYKADFNIHNDHGSVNKPLQWANIHGFNKIKHTIEAALHPSPIEEATKALIRLDI